MSDTYAIPNAISSQNWLARLAGIFINPRKTFEDIVARPSFLVPLIILALVTVGLGFATKDIVLAYIVEKMRTSPFMDNPQARAEIEKQMAESPDSIYSTRSVLSAPLWGAGFWVIITAVVLFTGNIMLGGSAKFKTLFAVTCWAGMVDVLRSLARSSLVLMNESVEVATSLAMLFPPESKDSFLFMLVNRFDFFSLWLLFVYAIGVSVVYKFSVQKSSVMVFSLWALWSAVFLTFNKFMGGMYTFM